MPQPSKFTTAVQGKLLEARGYGAPQGDCAAYAGVAEATLSRWLTKGREAKEPESAYARFYERWLTTTAQPKIRALRLVHDAMADKPELAMKYIERQVDGFAPPQPSSPAPMAGPVIINVALNDGRRPEPETVISVPNVSALPASSD